MSDLSDEELLDMLNNPSAKLKSAIATYFDLLESDCKKHEALRIVGLTEQILKDNKELYNEFLSTARVLIPFAKKRELTPTKIADIIFRIDEYLEYMQEEIQNASEFINYLDRYIITYLDVIIEDELELKKLAVQLINETYIRIINLAHRDLHVDAYFGIIVNRLFFELANKNILVFFILDNEIRDDRFKLVVELFGVSHFKTVHPYVTEKLEYGQGYTQFASKEYKLIDEQIFSSVSERKNIIYIEKDNSVNYLNEVLSLAEKVQDKYVCAFKNQSPESDEPALWLIGSFGNILKNKKDEN